MDVYYLYGAPSRHKMMDDMCYSSLKQKLFEFCEFMQTKAVQNISKNSLYKLSLFPLKNKKLLVKNQRYPSILFWHFLKE